MNKRSLILLMGSLLLLAAIFSPQAWGNWLLLQLSVVPLFLRFQQSVSGLISSLLLGIGFWIGLPSTDPFLHQVGVVFLCVGIGGLLGWFPFPRTRQLGSGSHECFDQLGETLIPVCIAAIFVYRSIQHFIWSEQDLSILSVVSLFSLALCGIRLLGPLEMPQRIRLSILTILSNTNIASILMGWVKLYPDRTWTHTSNLPSAENLFQAILFIETLAVIVLTLSLQRLFRADKTDDQEASFVEKMASHPWLKKLVLISSLSLSGMPFLPGSIWRFLLIATFMLPQSRSNVTYIAEPQHGFIVLAIAFVIATVIVSLGQLRMFQLLLCAQPQTSAVVSVSAT